MEVIEINDKNIDEMISKNKKVVIDCYADWCGPCKMLSPIIDEFAKENENINFYKINVDDNEATVSKYRIMSIPTLLIFEDSKLTQTLVGFHSKEELNEMIK